MLDLFLPGPMSKFCHDRRIWWK